MSENLAAAFSRYFEVISADTPELLDEVYRLRYEVYCVENSFEDAASFPDGKERDECDAGRAVHSLVRHRESGAVAATVRLVLPDPVDAESPFPIEEHCRDSFRSTGFNRHLLPRCYIAEISRFAVSKNFKRRMGEAHTVAGIGPQCEIYSRDAPDKGARMIPHLTLGLFNAIVRMSAQHGIKVWYAVMEQSLLRLLTRFGISLRAIGGPVEYHGLRQPCYGIIDQVLYGIWEKRPEVWELITEDGAIWPAPSKTQHIQQINTSRQRG